MPFWSKRSYDINNKPTNGLNKINYDLQPPQSDKTVYSIQLNNNIKSEEGNFKKINEKILKNKRNSLFSFLKKNKEKKVTKKVNDDDGKDVSVLDLFRYADCFDNFLLIIGVIAALGSAGLYPLMFYMYGRAAGTFVDYSKNQNSNQTLILNLTNFINKSCFEVTEGDGNFDDRISFTIILYISIGCASLFCNYVSSVCWSTAAERQVRRIRNLLFERILSQEMAFFDKNTPGDLNSRITSNVNTLQLGFGFKFTDSISMLGRGIACLILAMVSAWKFSIVYLGIAPIIITCTACMVIMIKKYTIEEFKAYGIAGRIAQETLSAIRTVFSFGLQKKESKNYENSLNKAEQMSIKKGAITGIFGGISGLFFNAMFGIGIYYGVYLVRSDCENYKPGLIMQSFFAMITTIFSLGQALPFLKDMTEARGAAKSIYKILDKKSEIDVKQNKGKIINNFVGNINFENVFFNYPQRPDAKILQGLNLSIPAGKTIALCGSSGGGKSTVIQLLQRFYDPLSGIIKIDGNNLSSIDLHWWRNQMALVSQEPVLFALTIKENIRLGRLDATDEEIEQAAKQANAHNFIMTLNDKYDTFVGERGSQLSGGQKQRIAIARALVRNPKILLLDEATSALDLESEKIVQDALDKAKLGRTTIIIAHRLSTIRNADLIIAMANGQVSEIGTHDVLMQNKGIYYELVMRQTKEVNKPEKIDEEEQPEQQDDDDDQYKNIVVNNYENDFSDNENDENEDVKSSPRSPKSPKLSISKNTNKKRCRTPLKLERMLWSMSKPETGYILLGTVAQLINGATFPVVSLIFCEIYTIFAEINPKKQELESLKMMGIILGIAVAGFLSNLSFNFCFTTAGARLTKRLRAKMFNSILRQEVAWHDLEENRSSILATRLGASVPLCKGLTVDWLNLISQGISGVGVAIVVALYLNWKLALVMLVFVPVNFISGMISARASLNTNIKGKSTIEEAGKLSTECVENIKTLVSLSREDFFHEQFKKIFKRKFKRNLGLLHVQAFFYSITNSLLFFVQATAFGYGYQLMKSDNLQVSDLFRIYATITFSSMILGRVFSQMPDKNKASDAAKAAFKIIHRIPIIDSMSENGIKPNTCKGEIEFNDVHFKYPTRDNKILKGLNLKINSNETTALVGQSGCGKSTCIQLLLRFYDVDKGKITLDGVDIRKLNINWLRSQIGLVSQEPVLFNCSIFENICYGDVNRNDITINEVVDVAQQSNIHQKVENLPDKYNTIVGTKGGQLSGGEKQRVAIARALIRKPRILLLDEATSALDTQSEQVVQDALDRAQIGRTCICIAHRLSTIQNAPKISVFKNGRVVEEGTHTILMNNKNIYFTLQTQIVNN